MQCLVGQLRLVVGNQPRGQGAAERVLGDYLVLAGARPHANGSLHVRVFHIAVQRKAAMTGKTILAATCQVKGNRVYKGCWPRYEQSAVLALPRLAVAVPLTGLQRWGRRACCLDRAHCRRFCALS